MNEYALRELAKRSKEAKKEKYLEDSRQRLDNIMSQKIRTSFIGALSAFEEAFGFLWRHGEPESSLNEQEREMRELYNNARTQLLNNGNNQLRAAKTEISNHIIEWKRFNTSIPITNKPLDEGGKIVNGQREKKR